MKNKLSTIVSALLLSGSLYAKDINIVKGWQMKGSDSGFSNMDAFNKSCIDTIWNYDTSNKRWKAYSPSMATQNLINNSFLISSLSSLNESDGFWVKANNDCVIDGNSTNSTTLNDGLVAYYEFEGNAKDSSGNGNDGIEHGGVSYVDGVIGQAGNFDGVDDYIEITDHSLNITDSISISLWKKIPNKAQNILQWGESCPDGNSNYNGNTLYLGISQYYEKSYDKILNEDEDKFFVIATDGGGNFYDGRFFAVSKEDLNESIYENLLFTFDNKLKEMKLYKNGVLMEQYSSVDTGSSSSVKKISFEEFKDVFISEASIKIGATESYCNYEHKFKNFISGLIDDLRIYNRALSESEIQELYNLGK